VKALTIAIIAAIAVAIVSLVVYNTGGYDTEPAPPAATSSQSK
jgi:hypothetical protein